MCLVSWRASFFWQVAGSPVEAPCWLETVWEAEVEGFPGKRLIFLGVSPALMEVLIRAGWGGEELETINSGQA